MCPQFIFLRSNDAVQVKTDIKGSVIPGPGSSSLTLTIIFFQFWKKIKRQIKMSSTGREKLKQDTKVSVIIPVFNGASYFDECMESVRAQQRVLYNDESDDDDSSMEIGIEVSIFDDASTDETPELIQKWDEILSATMGFSVVHSRNRNQVPNGVGYAKNRAVEQSTGEYLCFCDADDIMRPDRVVQQLKAALCRSAAIVGSKFARMPVDSTKSFSRWANNLNETQLSTQIYQSFGPTLVMPTWFCHRAVFNRISHGFSEDGQGVAEDLIFFYKHIDHNGTLVRVDQELITYRYHTGATTFSVQESTIWNIRLRQFQKSVLEKPGWEQFSIWGAGKLGRRFLKSLDVVHQKKVRNFCDVDLRKVQQGVYEPYPNPSKLHIPIISYCDSKPPYVICTKIEYTWDPDNPFRRFVAERKLQEGLHFYHFS